MGVVVFSRGGHQETQGVEVPELVQWGQTEWCRRADLQLLLVAQQGKRYTVVHGSMMSAALVAPVPGCGGTPPLEVTQGKEKS